MPKMSNNPNLDDWLETYKSLVTFASEGFKFCALANGGSAVAILAYLGNVVGHGSTAPDMRVAMASFLLGLFFCGVAMIFAYWIQLNRLNRLVDNEDTRKDWRLPVAALLVIASLLSFAYGSWQAVVSYGTGMARADNTMKTHDHSKADEVNDYVRKGWNGYTI